MPEKTLQIGLIMFMIIIMLSCNNSDLKVKPDKTSTLPTTTPKLEGASQSFERTPAFIEMETESLANTNHAFVIGLACNHYLASYGSMPDTLNELLDGFTFLWPANLYTGKPMKILDSMPDINNPNDIEGVYYELINYHSARLHYLDKIPSDSQSTDYEWFVGGFLIKPLIGWDSFENTYEEPAYLTEMESEERIWYGYQRNLQMTLPFLIYDAINRRGEVEDNILDLMNASQFYILKPGYDKLKTGLSEGLLNFDLGSIGDMEHFYYYDYDIDNNYAPRCFKRQENGKRSFPHRCTEFDSNKVNSLFNSDDFDTYTFPEEVFITRQDVF